ncbi:MAG: sigma-54 dependent transcriptional regulator [Desulfosoma sp.]
MTGRILVVDDDGPVRDLLQGVLEDLGLQVRSAASLEEALQASKAQPFDVVFLDVWLPDGCGLDALEKFRNSQGRPEVVIMTGRAETSGAALAMEHGAWDYLSKPLMPDDVRLAVVRALDYRRSSAPPSAAVFSIPGLVATSPAMMECLHTASQAAACDVAVLITGETGTGKELIARGIHGRSARSAKPFVVVDCTVIPEHLVESHLFGHEKGAFTGADKSRVGLVKLAHGGTLFLDEVGDLPPAAQAKLLRVLQEKTFRPMGSSAEVTSDFRVIAATHRNLEDMVQKGAFRRDLYYRLAGMRLAVPPLRDRKDDILPIIQDILRREASRGGGEVKGLSPDFLETVLAYSWPGNVRELLHATLHALAVSPASPTLFAVHLPPHVRAAVSAARAERARAAAAETSQSLPQDAQGSADALEKIFENPQFPTYKAFRQHVLDWADRRYFERLLERCGGNVEKACALSGLSRSRLYALLKEAGSIRPQSPPDQASQK